MTLYQHTECVVTSQGRLHLPRSPASYKTKWCPWSRCPHSFSPTTTPWHLHYSASKTIWMQVATVTALHVLLSSERCGVSSRLFVWPPVALDLQNCSFRTKTRVQLLCERKRCASVTPISWQRARRGLRINWQTWSGEKLFESLWSVKGIYEYVCHPH